MIKKMSDIALPFIEAMARPGAPMVPRVLMLACVWGNTPVFWMLSYFEQAEYWATMRRHHRTQWACHAIIELACVPHLIGVCALALLFPQEAQRAR